jgi:hypothetical protein
VKLGASYRVRVPVRLIINEYPENRVWKSDGFGVATGGITKNCGWGEKYVLMSKPNPTKGEMNSVLWRGYVSHYKLINNGALMLEYFEYPLN